MRPWIVPSVLTTLLVWFIFNINYNTPADDLVRTSGEINEKEPASTPGATKSYEKVPEISLLEARRQGLVSVQAEGRGDGRMTVSITNRTERRLCVVLPPGLVAQCATGQFGGIGGPGGVIGGMGGGVGGHDGRLDDMSSTGRYSATMPAVTSRMLLLRMIMYFCGDPDSWDKPTLVPGVMGSMSMGGIDGGMRSVPPTGLPSALLNAGETRHLPTRLIALRPPVPEQEVKLPEKGEPLQLGDIREINENPRVQKALRRLTTDAACKSIARLVMWHLTAGVDWGTLAQLSSGWANRYELTLARDFVDHLEQLPSGETGRVLFEVEGEDAASEVTAIEVTTALKRKVVLGLIAESGIPARPGGPAVALRVRMSVFAVRVIVLGSDAAATKWIPLGLFTVPPSYDGEGPDVGRLTDAIAERALDRLVRVQLSNGIEHEGKMHYQLRIDNASPLVLNGLTAVGASGGPDAIQGVLSGICLSPQRSMTVPASEALVNSLGLKNGIKLIALDLSGL